MRVSTSLELELKYLKVTKKVFLVSHDNMVLCLKKIEKNDGNHDKPLEVIKFTRSLQFPYHGFTINDDTQVTNVHDHLTNTRL